MTKKKSEQLVMTLPVCFSANRCPSPVAVIRSQGALNGKEKHGAREVTGFPSGPRCKVFTMTALTCCLLLLRMITYSVR